MGIHSGPVSEVNDVSGRNNIAGAGINMAQRVMDCGDAGHILVSQHVADDLVQYRQWAPRLRDLGECEVKHGVRLHLVNLYAEPLGNPEVPEKFRQGKEMAQTAVTARASGRNKLLLVVLGIVIFFFICLAIVAFIFAPAVMKSLSRQGAVMPPPSAPSATASPTIDAILAQGPTRLLDRGQLVLLRAGRTRSGCGQRALVALGDNPSRAGPGYLSRSFGEGLLARMTKMRQEWHCV